ncbi:DUF6463 family protein [Nocardia sp. NBC_01499]|uniref:DUF6463 family protein n=1 Tax=Nocardia sp. NBC_01499 TaxID=2903597 RepID=UPI00386F11BD
MIKWAGWLIVLCGFGHLLGSLVETAPSHAGAWFSGELWGQGDPLEMSHATAAFWYSGYSFGPLLLLVGLIVLWLGRRNIVPPQFIAWTLTAWVMIGFVVGGPSPLPILLIAAGLLLAAARRDHPAPHAHAAG